jgi:hypothetical protein
MRLHYKDELVNAVLGKAVALQPENHAVPIPIPKSS